MIRGFWQSVLRVIDRYPFLRSRLNFLLSYRDRGRDYIDRGRNISKEDMALWLKRSPHWVQHQTMRGVEQMRDKPRLFINESVALWRQSPRQFMIVALSWLGMAGIVFMLLLLLGGLGLIWRMNSDLPSYDHLINYEPSVMTRIYAADGTLISEYAKEYRLFVPYEEVPPFLIKAFVSAEDKSYWEHPGFDIQGVARAVVTNISRVLTGERLVGGSTITQQVARVFLLNQQVKFERKIKEVLLALRLERVLSKEQIMELYVNQIYLGLGSYGVAAASLNYFGKALSELNLPQMAYLAALPKGPNNYHPTRNKAAAIGRRNWVLERMYENGYITDEQRRIASAAQIYPPPVKAKHDKRWAYFSEDVRRLSKKLFGARPFYEGGLAIHATLDTQMQKAAYYALRNGLSAYDRRHGWRGAIRKLPPSSYWPTILSKMTPPKDIEPWRLAVVLKIAKQGVKIGLRPNQARAVYKEQALAKPSLGFIPFSQITWARQQLSDGRLARPIKHPNQVLEEGDIVYVEPMVERPKPDPLPGIDLFSLRQLPQINGAIVAMDPHSGRVKAMTGGFSFSISEFNRATQAWRQPGSAIKPFVYAAALDNGFTPVTKVMDAPFVGLRGEQFLWKPSNYGEVFGGPTLLRKGLELSRNLMTVHLTNQIGLGRVMDYTKRFGLATDIRPELSLALGSEETTLLRLTNAYAILANGGQYVRPFTIERIQDRFGRTIYRHDRRLCKKCNIDIWRGEAPPQLADTRNRVISAQTAYQIVSMLQGAVKRGTGRAAYVRRMTIAGKTGTTNKERDAWFVGFSPDLVVGVFIGFDQPTPMGEKESGGGIAAPIFADFIKRVQSPSTFKPFPVPPGITLVRIDTKTGKPTSENKGHTIWEAFKTGTEPDRQEEEIVKIGEQALDEDEDYQDVENQDDEEKALIDDEESGFSGTGGLY